MLLSDLFKKFEMLDGKPEMLYSWNENAYRKMNSTHLQMDKWTVVSPNLVS